MKKIKKIFSAIASGAMFLPLFALAQFQEGLDDIDDNTDIDLARSTDAGEGVQEILVRVIEFILGFLAALAILVIIIAGVLYITSGGDEDRIERAKTYLIFAIVGLVVALLGFVIVSAVSQALIEA